MLRSLERGARLEDALLAEIRSLVSERDHARAQSIATSLRLEPATRVLGDLAEGIVAFDRGFLDLAWDRLSDLPRKAWAAHAPAEYVRTGLSLVPERTLDEVRGLVKDGLKEVGPGNWYEILGAVFGWGAQDVARDAFAALDQSVRQDPAAWSKGAALRDWMRSWVAADSSSPTAPAPPLQRTTIAVMDYGHPGAERASANLGDHVQSIAALGHLVRHQSVRFHGRDDLVGLLERLRDRTRPERRLHDVDADVEVITVHRDASTYAAIPAGTWVLCFGWYMHAIFKMRHDFPLHRNLRPIFVSFHCNKRELLTDDGLAYLRRYGPVGCRDWTTVYLLRSCDVPAFFSGCVTTTIDTVFPDRPERPTAGAPTAYVDMPADEVPPDAPTYRHSHSAVRRRSFVGNCRRALQLLETYRREHSAVVTSRLHCYLPLRSMGVPVDFRPKRRADIRFDGLTGLTDKAFADMRNGLLEKLEHVHRAILMCRPESEVYALWRDLTADDVALADRRLKAAPSLPTTGVGVKPRLERARSRSIVVNQAEPDAVHCAVVLPAGGGRALSVLIASLLERRSSPLHLWVLARPGAGPARRRIAARFPDLGMTWVPLRGLERGLEMPAGVTHDPKDLVRLVLADLLPGVGRVVLLPLPAVVTADIATLADLDLNGHALAAPARSDARGLSGFGVVHAAAKRLERRPDLAAELRRTAHARHRFDFQAFSGDVLVVDLERFRQEALMDSALAVMQAFGLTDLEALHYLVGPARATVPPRWSTVPTRTPAQGDGLMHWADRVKPWHAALTPERDLWRRYAGQLSGAPAGRDRSPMPS